MRRCEVIERYRLSPERIEWLISKFEGQLRRDSGRNAPLDPEIQAVVENKGVLKIFKTTEFQRRIQAVGVDEAHFVIDWKEFRPSYGKLGILRSIFPKVPLLGMTATVTKRACRDIIESLGMFNPAEVIGNPNQPNI
ncbi:ATP-dependent DNA helicase Q-like 3 [Acropora cervicornis]|uniref:DNA 3'-5' helicase n=1 Tax=Acropora cervicornis TaxID=6130 RepID=A0AAD9QUH9_ACRCE|nr:ATP-dependent DNA helicase Q-like 3 [Acropora cervicornis]